MDCFVPKKKGTKQPIKTEGMKQSIKKGGGLSNPPLTCRCGSLLLFLSADARSSDDVIAF